MHAYPIEHFTRQHARYADHIDDPLDMVMLLDGAGSVFCGHGKAFPDSVNVVTAIIVLGSNKLGITMRMLLSLSVVIFTIWAVWL